MSITLLNPEQVSKPIGPYSQGALTQGNGNWLHVAGQIGTSPDEVMPQDFVAQADLCWANVCHVLAEAGMDVSDLVKVTTYVVGTDSVPLLGPVRLKYLGDARPAATLIVVDALARPEWKIEIEAIAFKASA